MSSCYSLVFLLNHPHLSLSLSQLHVKKASRAREGEKSIRITMEKVALMAGIAAYVYTKSGNLSSYARGNACGVRVRRQARTRHRANYCSTRSVTLTYRLGTRMGKGEGVRVQGDFNKRMNGLNFMTDWWRTRDATHPHTHSHTHFHSHTHTGSSHYPNKDLPLTITHPDTNTHNAAPNPKTFPDEDQWNVPSSV